MTIVDLIQSTSPRTLSSLSLVNRMFNDLTSYARARDLHFNLHPKKVEASQDLLKIIEKKKLLSAISTLVVTDRGPGSYCDTWENLSAIPVDKYRNMQQYIADLMPRMTGLKVLSYNYGRYCDEYIPNVCLEHFVLAQGTTPRTRYQSNNAELG